MDNKQKCTDCQHYYITWDKSFPYGCKAMGFKSPLAPSIVVRQSSGQNCLAFLKKQTLEKNNL